MGVQICLLTWWYGHLVGEDRYGNRYFEDKKHQKCGKTRRWVIYKGDVEASKVPVEWHSWLHHSSLNPPKERNSYFWEKPHQPNLTGTTKAYRPSNNKPPYFYEPWSPSE